MLKSSIYNLTITLFYVRNGMKKENTAGDNKIEQLMKMIDEDKEMVRSELQQVFNLCKDNYLKDKLWK